MVGGPQYLLGVLLDRFTWMKVNTEATILTYTPIDWPAKKSTRGRGDARRHAGAMRSAALVVCREQTSNMFTVDFHWLHAAQDEGQDEARG